MYRTERLSQAAVVVAVLGTAGAGHAATAAEFYLNLLRRGVAEFEGGRFDNAAPQLRIAAFGLIDSVEHYQTAQVYLAIALDRLADPENARVAARRVVNAERVGRSYRSLNLPVSVRASFDAIARNLLMPAELQVLQTSPQTVPRANTPSTTTPAATTTTPVQPQPQPVPPPAQAQPANTARVEPSKPQPAATKPAPQPAPTRNDPPKPQPSTSSSNQAPPQQSASAPTRNDPPKPAPTTTTPPQTAKPAPPPAQAATTTKPAPQPAPAKPAPPRDINAAFTDAERALNAANLVEARRIYAQLLEAQLTHEQALRAAEGSYRARDFTMAIRAFDRAGALRKGEEPYRYYLAVAFYETGKYAAAKKELATVLPFIEITSDVQSYRTKIENAID